MSIEHLQAYAPTDLVVHISKLAPNQAAAKLEPVADKLAAEVLSQISPGQAEDVMLAMSESRQAAVIAAAPSANSQQWTTNFSCPEHTVGRLMEPPSAIFTPEMSVAETVEQVCGLVKNSFVTYGFIIDEAGVLTGVITMRDLLLADRDVLLKDIMLREPFSLQSDCDLIGAMKLVVNRHYPVYPVCDSAKKLVGTVRGRVLFEHQAFEISAQVGSMVGVEKEERLSTPWQTSLRYRHPWLQLNLLTAFVAAAVVGFFQSTIDQMVVLAMFLPVLAGQSGNTGCQSLAVTLRGLTLGDLKSGKERRLVMKEGLLGLFNGILVGITAGIGMFVVASAPTPPPPPASS